MTPADIRDRIAELRGLRQLGLNKAAIWQLPPKRCCSLPADNDNMATLRNH